MFGFTEDVNPDDSIVAEIQDMLHEKTGHDYVVSFKADNVLNVSITCDGGKGVAQALYESDGVDQLLDEAGYTYPYENEDDLVLAALQAEF